MSKNQGLQNSDNRGEPKFSVINEKNDLKKIDYTVNTMQNRVQLLRQQLQKEKDTIKKNKSLTKQVIQKKIEVNKINRYKQKDHSAQKSRIDELRKHNKSVRLGHQRQLEQIQKAIYLVKLDDAREAKNISMQHRNRIESMNREFLSAQKDKKMKVAEDSAKAKEKYMQYWKEKLSSIYMDQAKTIEHVMDEKQKKKQQLKSLEQEQIHLMEEINKYHTQQVQTKKQYLAALSLPVKQVAEAMGDYEPKQRKSDNRRYSNRSSLDMSNISSTTQTQTIDRQIRLPNASVNQTKLKVILKQLKKMNRDKETYSARDY